VVARVGVGAKVGDEREAGVVLVAVAGGSDRGAELLLLHALVRAGSRGVDGGDRGEGGDDAGGAGGTIVVLRDGVDSRAGERLGEGRTGGRVDGGRAGAGA
jgi:hypothetical protein